MSLETSLAWSGAVLCAALAILAPLERRSFARNAFAVGMALLSIEAALIALATQAGETELLRWQRLRLVARVPIAGVWLLFALSFARAEHRAFVYRWRWIVALCFGLPLATVALWPHDLVLVAQGRTALLGRAGYALHIGFLIGAVLVLMNLEKTLRASTGSMRWFIKFMALGVGGLFAIRLYTASQAILFRSLDADLLAVDAAALPVAAGLIVVSLFRMRLREVEVYVSPTVLYHSLTVLLVGVYLLVVGVLAWAARRFGGAGTLPFVTFLVLLALLALTSMLLSDEVRGKLRRFVARHFRRPQYDYRSVWTTFTERTRSVEDLTSLCLAVAKVVSETLRVPSVTVWLHDDATEKPVLGGSTVYSAGEGEAFAARHGADFAGRLGAGAGPVDLLERRQADESLPEDTRYGVALAAGGESVGFLLTGPRPRSEPFTPEDFDLLKTIADQAAASLLHLRLSQRLLRAKEMAAFQSLSAFFVHDLKNLASKLSLTLQNLPTHYEDPAFRDDLLAVISRSVAKINDMCSRLSPLSSGLELHRGEADLNEIVRASLVGLNGALRGALVEELGGAPVVYVDAEEIQKVVTNLVLNANDAVDAGGHIRVSTGAAAGTAFVAVSDDGVGMSPEFVARSLFQPFRSTKQHGLGIGLYHCKTIVEAHRGRIEVESTPGRGSTFRVVLPAAGA